MDRVCLVREISQAEERELEAETMAVGRLEVPGVIPPFGAVVGMVEMIARELVMVSGLRRLVLRRQRHYAAAAATPIASSLFLMDHFDGVQMGGNARGIKAGQHRRA